MNAPLPEICCLHCNLKQVWRNQKDCVHCGKHLSQWHVAAQLAHQPAPWNIRKPEFKAL